MKSMALQSHFKNQLSAAILTPLWLPICRKNAYIYIYSCILIYIVHTAFIEHVWVIIPHTCWIIEHVDEIIPYTCLMIKHVNVIIPHAFWIIEDVHTIISWIA